MRKSNVPLLFYSIAKDQSPTAAPLLANCQRPIANSPHPHFPAFSPNRSTRFAGKTVANESDASVNASVEASVRASVYASAKRQRRRQRLNAQEGHRGIGNRAGRHREGGEGRVQDGAENGSMAGVGDDVLLQVPSSLCEAMHLPLANRPFIYTIKRSTHLGRDRSDCSDHNRI